MSARIRAAIVARGTDTESVATAVGMRASELDEHLTRGDLSMPDVVRVGGVLLLSPTDLYGDAA
ncbi:hypothetical protein GA0004736_3374 [Curtobacterium sp. 9128]|uniref:hypothetical protein n=1 Tax=Curtobacterium sp. 9128 TaxID=1793722 RepID=UPI0007D71620|nr:hypothetical protein [Curtobacterium sp. 9128]SBN64414.1 hypothetical protein GA0004736_3374 [Curtobacterium sp. 9128]